MKRGSSPVPPPPGEPDSTQRLVHLPATGLRPLAPPSSPEMTGRIHLPASPERPHDIKLDPPEAEQERGVGSTVSFSLEAVELQVDPRVSASVGYQLGREIARGGMGKIFAAHDSELERTVALKISSLRDRSADGQFIREAKVLAHLSHPNIVPIHNIGVDSSGRPFYSMKLVNGRTLHSILRCLDAGDKETLSSFGLPILLSVFRKVCDAVAYAHARGYLHRDLKPDNIMVGEFGEVLVMDWGLAKIIRGKCVEGVPQSSVTDEPDTLPYVEGTPQYMSPEQAEGVYGALDERSDVYSLGGILHAILTKRPPFSGSSVEEVLRQVRRGGITTLSASEVGDEPGTAPSLEEGVPDALRAVTLKAMAREPGKRYQSVAALAADIDAYQGGFATSAEEASLLRLGVLFVKRHRAASVAAALLVTGALAFAIRLDQSKRRADASAADARLQARRASESARNAEHQARLAAHSEKAALAEKELAKRSNAEARIALAEAAENAVNPEGIEEALAGVPVDLRDQQWRYLKGRLDSSDRTIQVHRKAGWRECVPHPNRPGVLVTLQEDNWIRSLELSSGQSKDLIQLQGNFYASSLGVSPDGQKVAVLRAVPPASSGKAMDEVQVYELGSGKPIASFQVPSLGSPAAIKFNSDGRLLLTVQRDAGVAVYEISSGSKLWERTNGRFPMDGEFSAPADVLQLASKNFREVVDARTGIATGRVEIASPPESKARYSQSALFFSTSNTIRRVDPANGGPQFEFKLPSRAVSVDYLPLEKLVVDLWQVSERSAALEFRDPVTGVLIGWNPVMIDLPFGSKLREWKMVSHPGSGEVCVFRGGVMKVWKFSSVNAPGILEGKNAFMGRMPSGTGMVFLDNPERLLHVSSQGHEKTVDLLHLGPQGARREKTLAAESIAAGNFYLCSNRIGSVIAHRITRGGACTLTLFRSQDGLLQHVSSMAFPFGSGDGYLPSPRGDQLWSRDGFYSAADGTLLRPLDRSRVDLLKFGDDRYYEWTDDSHVVELATVFDENEVPGRALVLWSSEKAEFRSQLVPNARCFCVSPDGTQLAEGGGDGKLRIRSAQTLKLTRTLRVQDALVIGVAWHPTLPYVATSSEDRRLRIWDIDSGVLVQEYRYMGGPIFRMSWSPDGQVLLLGTEGSVHFLRPSLCPPVP